MFTSSIRCGCYQLNAAIQPFSTSLALSNERVSVPIVYLHRSMFGHGLAVLSLSFLHANPYYGCERVNKKPLQRSIAHLAHWMLAYLLLQPSKYGNIRYYIFIMPIPKLLPKKRNIFECFSLHLFLTSLKSNRRTNLWEHGNTLRVA